MTVIAPGGLLPGGTAPRGYEGRWADARRPRTRAAGRSVTVGLSGGRSVGTGGLPGSAGSPPLRRCAAAGSPRARAPSPEDAAERAGVAGAVAAPAGGQRTRTDVCTSMLPLSQSQSIAARLTRAQPLEAGCAGTLG